MPGSVVGGIFGMIGSNKQAKAAEKAGALQAQIAREGTEMQREMFDTSVQLGNPWRHSGQNALGALSYELGLGPRPSFEVAPSTIGANNPAPLSAMHGRTDGPAQNALGALPGQMPGTTATPRTQMPATPRTQNALAQQSTLPHLSDSALAGLPPASRDAIRANPALIGAAPSERGVGTGWPMEDDRGHPRWMRDPGMQSYIAAGGAMPGQTQQPQQAAPAPAPAAQPASPAFEYQGFQATPGYQFQLDEGQKAINRSLAARGGVLSGAAVKAGMRFGQGLANQEYTNHLSRLAALSGVGGNFASSAGQNALVTGQNVSGTLQNGAAAQGGAMTTAGMARASGYNALGKGISTGINSLFGFAGYGGGGDGGGGGGRGWF